jgi:protein tyrosine phosphatase (PTP) superfamily phosphohydrolase (DUF442 family)
MRFPRPVANRAIVRLATVLLVASPMLALETNHVANRSEQVASRPSIARPAHWAVKLDVLGVPNFYRVTTNLYRGAQPTAEGMARLKAMGIRTIVNLRAFHSDVRKLAGSDLKGERLRTEPWHGEVEDVVRFLKIVANTNNLPAFVHCERGADRTGVMCAMYRVAVCGWRKDEAIREMTRGGFGFSPAWQNLIRFVRRADMEELKRRAGITPSQPQRDPGKQKSEAATTSPVGENQ